MENVVPLDVYLAELPDEPPTYRLQPGDQLEIRFHQLPEENTLLAVRPDGFISLPLADEVRAAGRTPRELRQELEQRYSKELLKPRIAVIVQSFNAYKVHVGGQVVEPGVFEIGAGLGAMEAILQAGGYLTSASLANVIVMRRTGPRACAVIPLDLEAFLQRGDVKQNLALQPFDLVFVPQSPIGDVNQWVDLYLRRNIPFNVSLGWRFDNFQS